jgi:hypothetical protein
MARVSTTDLANDGRISGLGIGNAKYFADAFWRVASKAASVLSVAYTFSRKAGICI